MTERISGQSLSTELPVRQ
ncbi:hypothetical protein A2U01_0104920, partial [Trifolium medium]|nr:hypothetical protein [Trifolium medium]